MFPLGPMGTSTSALATETRRMPRATPSALEYFKWRERERESRKILINIKLISIKLVCSVGLATSA